jgi:hypothetical protein
VLGVFGDNVQHVFVLATPVEVILLGVGQATLDGSPSLSFTELSTKTNNTEMKSIHGTDNGRIFMCGKDDHHIYEIQYKVPSVHNPLSLYYAFCLFTVYLHRAHHYQQHLHYGPPAHVLCTAGQKPLMHLVFSVVEVSNGMALKTGICPISPLVLLPLNRQLEPHRYHYRQ